MGEFEDFFEDDEILEDEEDAQATTSKTQEEPIEKPNAQNKNPQDPQDQEELAPGMIDLEAIEGTGGYSFDNDEEIEQTGTSHDFSDHQNIEIKNNSDEHDLEPDEVGTKTYNHFEHDEESIEHSELPVQETLDEKTSVVKNILKLSDEEKKQKINEVLTKSSPSFDQKEEQSAKSKNNDVFINLDADELFSDVIIDDLEPSVEMGIDIDEPKSLEESQTVGQENLNLNKGTELSTAKAADFDAFETFLKDNSEDQMNRDLSDEEAALEEDIEVPPVSRFQLPDWLEKISLPRISMKYILLGLVLVGLTAGYTYRKQIERIVFNRTPYTPPTDIELQQISVILSKAKQEMLFDHLLAQRKAMTYLNETLKIDPRHLETLYLKSIIQAQILLDDAVFASKSASEQALNALDEFYSQSIEFKTAEAYFLLAEGQVDKSVIQFKQLKDTNPNDEYISMGLAEALAVQKNYNEAYQAVSRIISGHRRIHYLKAFLLNKMQSNHAYEVYIASLGATNAYHPKLELLKLEVDHVNGVVNLEELKDFDLSLRKNILKFPKALLSKAYIKMSEIYLENENTEGAIVALKNASKNSDNDKVFFKVAMLEDKVGQSKEAVKSYAQAYKLKPDEERYLVYYLNSLRRADKLKEALKLADEKNEVYKASPDFLYEFALIKRDLLRTDEAIEALKQAKTLDNKQPIKYDQSLASIYMHVGDYESAYNMVNDILKVDPKNELALVYKAKVLTAYHVFGSAEKALASIVSPIENQYLVYDAYTDYYIQSKHLNDLKALIEKVKVADTLSGYEKDLLIAKRFIAINKNQDAIEHLQSHRLKNANDVNVNALLANAYVQDGNTDKAIEILQESVKVHRSDYETLSAFGRALVASGQLDLGIEKLNSASALRPKVSDVSYDLLKAYIAKDNQEKIEQFYQETIKKDPQFLLAHSTMAKYYFDSNLFSRAKPVYVKVIKLNPKDENALLNLGIIEKFNRNINKSKEYFRKVLALNKSNAKAYISLGILEEEGRDLQSAQRNFEMAKRVDSKNPEPYYLLGLLYRQQGKYQQALNHFKKYLELDPESKDKEVVDDQIVFLRKRIN